MSKYNKQFKLVNCCDDETSSQNFQISVNNGLDVSAESDSGWNIVFKFTCTTDNHCEGLCPIGTYSDVTGLNNVGDCKNCPGEKTTAVNGSTKVADCVDPDGTCPIGSKPSSDVEKPCAVCGYSLYSETAIFNASTPCLACPHGRYIASEKDAAEDHDSITKCIPCIGGRWYQNQTKTCEVCPSKFAFLRHCSVNFSTTILTLLSLSLLFSSRKIS